MFAPEIESMDRSDLAALQLERLKRTIAHATTRVGHYAHAFAARGVGTVDTLEDLRHFPFTTKDDLRSAYPFGMFAVPREQVLRIHASSGTTGRPTVVGYTKADLQLWSDLMARSLVAMGVRPSDIFHNAAGYGLFTGGLGFHMGAERLGCTVVPISGGQTQRQIQLLMDFGATAMTATPSYALHIAEIAEAEGIDLKSGPLRACAFGAEPWSDGLRDELEDRLGISACDMYGLSEIIGPGVACECVEAQDGRHGWEDHFLFEVIDPESGARLPSGETGELVITTLTKQAMPMIRYRTRDMTSLNVDPCVCGRTHVRLARISGRSDDMLVIRGVNIYPSRIEALLIGQSGIAPHHMLVVARDGAMDTLTIEVEAAPDIAGNLDKCVKTAQALEHHIKVMAGVTCAVEIKQPGELPRFEGKAARVRDLRK